MSDSIRRLLREPLVHFLLAGALLFVLFSFVSGPEERDDNEIVVTAGQVEHLTTLFLKTRQRLPTRQELAGLLDNHIVEEILYREAMRIGLDQDDTIIRRRLRQKMEFIFDDFSTATPTEDELQGFLNANPDRYRTDDRITFGQVYLSDSSQAEAETLLRELREGDQGPADELYTGGLLPAYFDNARRPEVSARLGEIAADEIFTLAPGEWSGPVQSPFGFHAVYIEEVTPGNVPELDEVSAEVERDWLAERRAQAEDEILESLRQQYIVTIEPLAEPEEE